MRIEMSAVDKEILSKHAPSVRGRALIELHLVDELLDAAQAAGYMLGIDDGTTDWVSDDDFKRLLFSEDDAMVHVFKDEDDQEAFGWVKLVFGNDGYDLISNHSTNLEAFLAPVYEAAKLWGG